MMGNLDDLSLSKLMQSDSSPQRQRALAGCTTLTLFIGKQVNRKWTYESKLFFEPHLDAHTSRVAEVKMAEHSALEVETLDEVAVNWLKSALPGITKVRIINGGNREATEQILFGVIQLLEHWANKLETFGIWTDIPSPQQLSDTAVYTTHLRPLFAVIKEKLTSLQYLTIAIPAFLESHLPLDVSFIGRLKLFSTDLPNELLIDSLNQHVALQEPLPEVRLFGFHTRETFAELLEMPSPLAMKMTALALYHTEHGQEQEVSFFVHEHFPALKWFQKMKCLFDIPHFLNSLWALSQLKHLKVEMDILTHAEYRGATSQLAPLPSIETLSISGGIRNRRFLTFFGPFKRRFPSLKWLNVQMRIFGIYTQLNPQETVSFCMHQFAQQQLKGSFQLIGEHNSEYYKYEEVFNFADGRQFEDWHLKEM